MVDGILLIDKEAGFTSHDVVDRVRRTLKQKRVGHCGTLDPAATGLLVIVLGRATRLAPWLLQTSKTYQGTIRLGRATTTGDGQGEITAEAACSGAGERLAEAAASLTGRYEQMPPAFSAVKIGGQPAYKIARKGEKPELKTRTVEIERFGATVVEAGDYPLVAFEVDCSSGTYIRSLAVDLGATLGCPAHLASLRRLRSGKFSVNDSLTVGTFAAMAAKRRMAHVVSMSESLDFGEVRPQVEDLEAARRGHEVVAEGPAGLSLDPADCGALIVKIVDQRSNDLIGLGQVKKIVKKTGQVSVKPFLVLASE